MTSSKKAVEDYLNNMFMDLALSDTVTGIDIPPIDIAQIPYKPLDSVELGARLVPCIDPFQLMDMTDQSNQPQCWLSFFLMLSLCRALPQGRVKQYCFAQCQTMNNQITTNQSN